MKILRIRFKMKAPEGDYRPIKWPIKYPYWCTGKGYDSDDENYFILIGYFDEEKDLYELWPEAYDLEIETCDEITFSDRFSRPDWFKG